jgi:hypothetical protein
MNPVHVEILVNVAKLSARSVDERIGKRPKKLAEREFKSDDLLDILDDCAHAALASDFVMGVLDVVWRQKLVEEKLSPADALKRAETRRRIKDKQG